MSRTALLKAVREGVLEALTKLPEGSPRVGTADQRWYWAAPFLLDRRLAAGENASFLSRMGANGTARTTKIRNHASVLTSARPTA